MYLQDILVHVLYEYFIGQVLKRFITQNLMGSENCNVHTDFLDLGSFWIHGRIRAEHLIFIAFSLLFKVEGAMTVNHLIEGVVYMLKCTYICISPENPRGFKG